MSKVNHTIDTSGQACPVPVLLTRRGLKKINTAEILEVIGDFFPAKKNIQDYVKKHGHEVLEVVEPGENGVYKIYIRKA